MIAREENTLRLICDEIFGHKNYMTTFSVKVRHEDRILKGDKDYHEVMEYMLEILKITSYIIIYEVIFNAAI